MAQDYGFKPDPPGGETYGFVPGDDPELGIDPAFPIQEQHPAISDATRFQIMGMGGGGQAGARKLEEQGLEVVHQGGMNYSVREPGKEWMVLDPEHKFFSPSTWELADITSDIAGDVGSIAAETYGAVKGGAIGFGLGGPPGAVGGAILGAGLGGGASQLARTGIGKASGLDPGMRETIADAAYEAAFGAASETLGLAGMGALKMVGRNWRKFRGGRLTVERMEVLHAIPANTQAEMRGLWDIAGVIDPEVAQFGLKGVLIEEGMDPALRGTWDIAGMSGALGQETYRATGGLGPHIRPRVRIWPGSDPIPFAAGGRGGTPARMRQTYGYGNRELRAKLVHEWYPEVRRGVLHMAQAEGKNPMEMAFRLIDEAYQSSPRIRRLFQAVTGHTQQVGPGGFADLPGGPAMFDDLISVLANDISKAQQTVMMQRLARVWKLDISDLSEKEIKRLLRRRMADDDFVYREAARKVGIKGAFDDDVVLEELMENLWKYEVARTAITKAGRHELIEAGFEGGHASTFTKAPPFDIEEMRRAAELAPFIRGERYRGEGVGPTRGPLERPQRAAKKTQVTKEMLDAANEANLAEGLPPVTREYLEEAFMEASLENMRRTKTNLRFDKLQQEADIMDIEYTRRVYGDRPDTLGPMAGKLGPLVDLGRRAEQTASRAAEGFGKPTFKSGGTGGMIPRADAVDFWRYLNLEQLKTLRVGGKEIQLTQPQSRMAMDLIFTPAVSGMSKKWARRVSRLAGVLQLPRSVLKATLTALRMKRTSAFLAGAGRTGALAGLALGGGIKGAALGAGLELLGRGAAKVARKLMRDPDKLLMRDVIRAAIKLESSRAHKKLLQAQKTFNQHGKTAFRALIYDAMHDPEVRKVFELAAPDE